MRVDDLRKNLTKYDETTLREMVVSLYKLIPKERKEEFDLDEQILNFSVNNKKPAKKTIPLEFSTLKDEILLFVNYANQHLYFAPNSCVRKNKRSKWRFEVKRFIKELLCVKEEDSKEASNLLCEIYAMLCYGCNYYIFPTENPFSAVGYSQGKLLDVTLSKLFYDGIDSSLIKKAVFLTLDSTTDRDTYYISLLYVLAENLKTPESKEIALSHCLAYQKEYHEYQASKEFFKFSSKDNFRYQDHCKQSADLYLILQLQLHEAEAGINYFWKQAGENNKEIILYRLLQFLQNYDDLWIQEYERALKNGIEPRKYLQDSYLERKINR